MSNNRSKNNSGFSLAELSIVMAIITVLSVVAVLSYTKSGSGRAIEVATHDVISILNAAKSSAISSQNATSSGVRISTTSLISFQGSYGNLNTTTTLSNLVRMSTSTGIGTDIIFSNVTGASNASGTITVYLLSDPTKTSIIRVYLTGAVEKN